MSLSEPRNQVFISAFIFIGAVIFGVFIIYSPFSFSEIKNSKITFENYNSSAKKIDADNDGLSDDEERLIGTNPEIADTDADGFLDGEEIASGHNPLIKSPGDDLKYNPLPGSTLINKNYTKEFSQYFFSKFLKSYLEDKKSLQGPESQQLMEKNLADSVNYFFSTFNNQTDSPTDENSDILDETATKKYLINQALDENQQFFNERLLDMEKDISKLVDIRIESNEFNALSNATAEEIKIYKNTIKNTALKGDLLFIKTARILKSSSQAPDQDIEKIKNEVNNLIDTLRTVKIPNQYRDFHITFFQYLLKEKVLAFLLLDNLQIDPLKSLFAFKIIDDTYQSIENYLNQANIKRLLQ